MARRELKITMGGPSFRELEVISVKRLCEACGDWKSEAFDVCWHPDVPCNRSGPDEEGS